MRSQNARAQAASSAPARWFARPVSSETGSWSKATGRSRGAPGQEPEHEVGLLAGLVGRDGLREEVDARGQAGCLGAVDVLGEALVGVERALGVAAVAGAHDGEVHAIGRHGRPVDGALVAGHVHAQIGAQLAVLVVGEPVAGAFKALPVVGARVRGRCRGVRGAGAPAGRQARCEGEQRQGEQPDDGAPRRRTSLHRPSPGRRGPGYIAPRWLGREGSFRVHALHPSKPPRVSADAPALPMRISEVPTPYTAA